jgi:hypothetical protein
MFEWLCEVGPQMEQDIFTVGIEPTDRKQLMACKQLKQTSKQAQRLPLLRPSTQRRKLLEG